MTLIFNVSDHVTKCVTYSPPPPPQREDVAKEPLRRLNGRSYLLKAQAVPTVCGVQGDRATSEENGQSWVNSDDPQSIGIRPLIL